VFFVCFGIGEYCENVRGQRCLLFFILGNFTCGKALTHKGLALILTFEKQLSLFCVPFYKYFFVFVQANYFALLRFCYTIEPKTTAFYVSYLGT
jgi:hypothetical protein